MDLEQACSRRELLKALLGGLAGACAALLGWRARAPRAWTPKDGWIEPSGALPRKRE